MRGISPQQLMNLNEVRTLIFCLNLINVKGGWIENAGLGLLSINEEFVRLARLQMETGARFFVNGNREDAPISVDETQFVLFTQNSPDGKRVFPEDLKSLIEADFDVNKKTVIVTHGFHASKTHKGQEILRQAYMDNMDVNYFAVDWSHCSFVFPTFYPVAIDCAFKVGKFIADFILFLERNGANLKDMHLIGHSLGSHAMSQVANYGIRVPRITGFDPTQVFFWGRPLSERLDPSDADFVDVIHTDVRIQGWNKLLGHVDFFPNGGFDQPECYFLQLGCDHEMAYNYFARSLYNHIEYTAVQCKSVEDANSGDCNGNHTYMGLMSHEGPHGIFYVDMT